MSFLNQAKTAGLLTLLFVFVLLIGSWLGGSLGLTIAFIIMLIFNFVSYWFSDKIVLKIYKAKKADHSVYASLHEMVKDISIRASIPKPEVYVIDSRSPNAFATGRNKKHASVAFTKGILDTLSEKELRGVIAHEIAHIKNSDILISTIAAVFAGTIAYVADIARWSLIFGGKESNNNMLSILVLTIFAPIIALILRMAISRSREFLADSTGAKFVKDSDSLADALVKIENSANKMEFGNQATASLFISNPFKDNNMISLFSTHPKTEDRIRKLRAMQF